MNQISSEFGESRIVGKASFFRGLEIDASECDSHSGCIASLRDGELTGIVVRSVYERGFMEDVAERLERHDPAFLKTFFPEKFRSWFYGRNLNLMGTDPAAYFAQAAEFHEQLSDLLSGEQSYDSKVLKLLSDLDEGRVYSAAPGPDPGQSYMMTTLRGHGEGGHIPAHCDNEQAARASYEHLQTLVTNHMYSAVLMIGEPEAGGALRVYDRSIAPEHVGDEFGALAGKVDLDALPFVDLSPKAGDLVVLDSGRFLHSVTPVEGDCTRWVACSFMSAAFDRHAVYCWG